MKKNLLKTMSLAAVATLALASCNQSNPQADAQAEAKQTAPTELKIAYVEVDSIMTQYKFCKDYSLILQKKGQNIQNTLLPSNSSCRLPLPISSRRCSRMPIHASRQKAYRPVCRSRAMTCRRSISA